MLKEIKTKKDVVAFAIQLCKEDVNFHPDNDFRDYINLETEKPSYTKKEANFRNELMKQCFFVCEKNGVDIYEAMTEIVLKETGMNNFIPLLSTPYVQ